MDTMLTVDELETYGALRIRLRKPRLQLTSFPFARQTVRLAEWTYYYPGALPDNELADLVRMATRDWYELDGHLNVDYEGSDEWVPLSLWRRTELRTTRDLPERETKPRVDTQLAVPMVESDVVELNRSMAEHSASLGLGETIYHLAHDLRRPPTHTLAVVQALADLGWQKMRPTRPLRSESDLTKPFNNGKLRREQDRPCRFCKVDLG